MASFKKEFKEFVLRGNVMDMAVGIIIGGAFGKIVSSLVEDILMPIIGLFSSGINFADLKWTIKEAVLDTNGDIVTAATTVNYGLFIQNIIDFLIIALVIFMMIRAINHLRKKQESEPTQAPAEPSEEVKLLSEIRDLLNKR